MLFRASTNLSTAAGLGAILLWSTTFAFARSISEQVGSFTGAAAVYLAGGTICLLRVSFSRETFKGLLKLPRPYLLGCGFLFIFYTAAVYLAIGLTRSRAQLLEIALVNYLWPALTVLCSLLILKKKAGVWLFPGTAIALAGIFLVVTQGASTSLLALTRNMHSNPAPYALALAAALSWALYSNLTRRWSGPDSSGAVEIFIPATGLVLLVLRALVPEQTQWSPRAMAEILALALITTLSYFLWDLSMRKGHLVLVVACSYLTPLLSTIVSCAYLHVALTPRLVIGCLLLISGSFITFSSVSD